MKDPVALARACADAMWAEDRASKALNMQLDDVAPGRARLSFVVAETMVNGHGICHGGYIFTLADSAMAFAANSYGEHTLAQHCTITYLRPAQLGEVLTAEATERARSGRSAMYDVRVSGTGAEVVAEFRGHTRTTGGKFVTGD